MDINPDRGGRADSGGEISTLNELIETARDGEEGFRSAADGVEDANLKRLFDSYSKQRGEFRAELQREVRRLGGDAERSGHVAGALHRGWINLKAALTGKDLGAVVSEAERGEDFAVKAYQKALEAGLPNDLRMIVERQYMQVREAHDHVRSLEETYAKQ